ncbi:MAG: gliding motility protein GldM [Bacteroidales bacterium]|nr:gliding motility protein GldM [Bacteroidales bacterium]
MAGGRQTPRQKLIGMMYLVLTALLALNVSVEVLDAFVLVDDGLQQTNVNFGRKVDMVYDDFRKQRALSEERVEPFYSRAMEVQEVAEELVQFILDTRTEMIANVDNISVEAADTLRLIDMKAKENYSRSSAFWLTEPIEGGSAVTIQPGGPGTRAYKLRTMIDEYKEFLVGQLPEQFRDAIQLGLDTEGPFYDKGGNAVTWQAAMFDRQPPVAAATNLSRLVTEVRNAEFDVSSQLYAAITADDFTFDKIEARVIPRSQIVLQGDRFEADVIVAAFDSRQHPEVIIGGRTIEGGRLSIPATSEGLQTYRGKVRVIGPRGIQEYDFSGDYIVQRPTATVSADAMNVFYIGVDNPVSVSVPGIPSGNIEPRISGAGNRMVPRAGGGYNVRISSDHNVNQNVTVTLMARVDGTLRQMGSQTFRVRTVPDPYPEIAGQSEGAIARDVLAGQPLIPRMRDFDFRMDFRITSFSMNTTVAGDFQEWRSNSNLQTPEMEAAIRRSTRGQRFQFENIQAVGDDGRVRNLPPMVFRIQ